MNEHLRSLIRSAHVDRIDVERRGRVSLTTRSNGRNHWHSIAGDQLVEILPEADPDLPLASRLGELRRRNRIELLAWKPGRRLVLRAGTSGASVILKGYRRGRLAAAVERHEIAALAARHSWIRVPSIVGRDHAAAFFSMADLGDHPLSLADTQAHDIARLGLALGRLRGHRTPAELGLHGPAQVLAELDGLRSRHAPADELVDPLPDAWHVGRRQLGEQARQLQPVPAAIVHRDLHDGQLLALERGIGLLDFDLLSRGDPVLDIANLGVHFELRALQGVARVERGNMLEFAARLVESAWPAQERDLGQRLDFYRAATFLRLALVYRMRPPWAHLVPILTSRAMCREGRLHDSA